MGKKYVVEVTDESRNEDGGKLGLEYVHIDKRMLRYVLQDADARARAESSVCHSISVARPAVSL